MLPESGSAILNKFDSSHHHTEKDPFYGTAVKVPVTKVIVWWRNTKKWIFSWQKTNKRPHGNVNNGQDAVENLFLERLCLKSEVLFARFVSNCVLWSRCNLTGKTARGIHSQHYTGILLSPAVTELIIDKAESTRLTVDPLCLYVVCHCMIGRSHQICPLNSHLSSFWSVNLRSSNDD